MTKQSNQRYRKEKESEHLKRAGVDNTGPGKEHGIKGKDKSDHEYLPDNIKR